MYRLSFRCPLGPSRDSDDLVRSYIVAFPGKEGTPGKSRGAGLSRHELEVRTVAQNPTADFRTYARLCFLFPRSAMNRGHRKEDVEKAYQIQSRAGAIGFAQYGAVGLGLASIGHHFWPSFRYVYEQPTHPQPGR